MIFKGLEIKKSYEKIGDSYQYVWKGQFNIESEEGHKTWLAVTPELCQKLINTCADAIVDVARETANSMKATILEQVRSVLIEKPTNKSEVNDEKR